MDCHFRDLPLHLSSCLETQENKKLLIKSQKFSTKFDDLGVNHNGKKMLYVQQGRKVITVDQSKVLKNRPY